MKRTLILLFISVMAGVSYSQQPFSGEWLGQATPDSVPLVFAKGFVSGPGYDHSSPEFSFDGSYVYWTVVSDTPDREAGGNQYNFDIYWIDISTIGALNEVASWSCD